MHGRSFYDIFNLSRTARVRLVIGAETTILKTKTIT